jgi:hypothetical protein
VEKSVTACSSSGDVELSVDTCQTFLVDGGKKLVSILSRADREGRAGKHERE